MAEIKLVFKPDYSEVSKAISAIKEDISKSTGNVKITIDSSSAQAAQSLASNLQGASSAAAGLNETLKKTETYVGGVIAKETERTRTAIGEYTEITKANDKVTETYIHNEEEKRKAARKTAEENEKWERHKLRYEQETARQIEAIYEKQRQKMAAFIDEQKKYEAGEANQAAAKRHQDRVEEIRLETEELRKQRKAEQELEEQKVKQAEAANRQLIKDEEEAQRKRTAAWKAYFDEINGLSDAKTKQGIEDNKRAILDEEEAQRKRTAAWKEYFDEINGLNDARVRQGIEDNRRAILDEEEAQRKRTAAWKAYFDEINAGIAQEERANKEREKASKTAADLERQYSNLIRQIQNLKAQYPEGTFDAIEQQAREARDELQHLDQTSATYAKDVELLGQKHQGLQRDLANVRADTIKLDRVTESLWMNFQKFTRWYLVGNISTRIIRSIRNAVTEMKNVDTQLTNIRKVSNLTAEEVKKIGDSAYATASKYGVAASEYLDAVYTFQKAGLGDSAEEMAELATKTMLVGDTTADIATQFIISANAAWKYGGDIKQLSNLVDEADYINNNYAATLKDIAVGLPIVGAAAAQVGMTAEQTMSAIATIVATTGQSASKAATALRAIIMNLIGQTGELDDGLVVTEETIASLNTVLNVYAKESLAAAEAQGKILDPMEAVAALAKAAEDGFLNEAQLFEVLSGLGGKLRTTQLTALVNNMETYNSMLEGTAEAAGTADKEIETMMDSWERKMQVLKNNWTEFVSHLVDTGAIKNALDGLTSIIDVLDTKMGRTVLKTGILTYATVGLSSGIIKLTRNIVKLIPQITTLGTKLAGLGATSAGTAAGFAGILGVTAAASVAMYKFLTTTEEEYKEATEEATSAYEQAKSEYDELVSKSGSLTDAERTRLGVLKEQLAVLRQQMGTSAYQQYMDKYDPTDPNKNAASVATQLQRDYNYQLQMARDPNNGLQRNIWIKNAEETKQKVREMADALREYSDLLGSELPESGKYALVTLDNMIKAWDAEEEAARKAAEETDKAAESDPKVKTLTERMAEASEAATKYDTAIGEVITAMTDFGAGSIEVYNAMVKLEAEIPGSTDKLYDFSTATWKIDASLIESKGDLLDFIDTQKQLEFSSAISQLEELSAGYWDVAGAALAAMNAQAAQQMAGVLAFTGVSFQSGAGLDNINTQLAELKAQKAEWDSYISTLRQRKDYSTPQNTGGNPGNTETPEDKELARLQSIVELRKAELSFLQASGASTEEIVAKYKEIQNALHDENERRRAIRAEMEAQGATEEELAEIDAQILGTSTEWWNVQKEINDALAETEEKTVNELERLESIVSLRKAELSFLEASGASEDELNAKRKEIQNALHEEAEYKRKIRAEMEAQGATEAELAKIDAEILALSTEWWEIQKDILETKQKLRDIDQTELNRLKGIVDQRKQELSFLEASGASEDEINAKRKEIQASLHDQAEEMRRILAIMIEQGATEEEIRAYETAILALSTEWWTYENDIEKSLERQKQLREEMFDTIKKTVDDYYAKILSDKEEELSLEEKILAVQKAQADLANAQRERTVRYYNAATGQWEWQANAKNVKSAQDALQKAQDDLNKYQKDQAWKAFKSAWEYVSEQIKAGAMTFREAYDYMYAEMKKIQDTYGVDLGFVLDDSIGGFKELNYGIDGLTQEVADTLGASVGVLYEKLREYETAVGAFKKAFDDASDKVKNGEMSMEDAYSYLRDRAKEIADKYGIDMTGALEEAIAGMDKTNMSIDELWKAVIINLMKVNSARWFDANEEERAYLHAQNEYLGSLIGATYDPSGYWYLNGSQLYGSQRGVDVSGKSGYGESTGGGGAASAGTSAASASATAIRGAAGTGKFYDSYGNEYATLEEAVAGNAANSGGGSGEGGKPFYKGTGFLAAEGDSGKITAGMWGVRVGDADGYTHWLGETGSFIKSSDGYVYNTATATDYELATLGLFRDGHGGVRAIEDGMYLDWAGMWNDHLKEMDAMYATNTGGGNWSAMTDIANNDLSLSGMDPTLLDAVSTERPVAGSGTVYEGDTYYTMNGVTIGESEAKSTTVYELARMAGMLGNYSA